MTRNKHIAKSDLFSGYLASIVLALIASHLLSGTLVTQIAPWFNLEHEMAWQYNISAGLFVGLAFADPVGMIMNRSSVFRALGRLVFGFAVGVAIQAGFVMPMAGENMARFVFLVLMLAFLPMVFWVNNVTNRLYSRGIDPKQVLAARALKVMSISDRLLTILIMCLTYVTLLITGATLQMTAIFMATVMAISVIYVTFIQAPEEDKDAWLYPDEEEEKSVPKQAWERFGVLVLLLAPGALIFGATMRIVLQALLGLYPLLIIPGAGIVPIVETTGLVLLCALGMMLMASVTALGLGLVLLIFLAKISSWSDGRTKEACIRLVKVMSFRRLRRPF